MPLCFPEKITSGPADMGVMGTVPVCIGAKGVAKAGGTMPEGRDHKLKKGLQMYYRTLLSKVKF